jgi:hypothetical protein
MEEKPKCKHVQQGFIPNLLQICAAVIYPKPANVSMTMT